VQRAEGAAGFGPIACARGAGLRLPQRDLAAQRLASRLGEVGQGGRHLGEHLGAAVVEPHGEFGVGGVPTLQGGRGSPEDDIDAVAERAGPRHELVHPQPPQPPLEAGNGRDRAAHRRRHDLLGGPSAGAGGL
jgi:hypothetical protein